MFKESFAVARENKFEKRENRQEKMDRLLANMATSINHDFEKYIPGYQDTPEKIISNNCSINIDAFAREEDDKNIKIDKEFVDERYSDWGGLENPKVQAFYRNEYGCQTEEEILTKYIENREKENGILLEKALTILLHRYLGENFLVLRSSNYDDFANGVDNLIINKETGEVICAFDGLNEEFNYSRRNKKLQKVIKKTKAGGAKIKYGLKFQNNELKKSSMENLPIFYLALNKVELSNLINGLAQNIDAPINNSEEEIVQKLLDTFEEQIQLLYQENIPNIILDKLESFEKTVKDLQNKNRR